MNSSWAAVVDETIAQTSSGFPPGIILSGIFLSGGGRSRRRRYRGTVTIVGVKVARVKRARNRGEKPEKEPGRELEGLNEDADRGNGGKPSEGGRLAHRGSECQRKTGNRGAETRRERERAALPRYIGVSGRDLFRRGMLIN